MIALQILNSAGKLLTLIEKPSIMEPQVTSPICQVKISLSMAVLLTSKIPDKGGFKSVHQPHHSSTGYSKSPKLTALVL